MTRKYYDYKVEGTGGTSAAEEVRELEVAVDLTQVKTRKMKLTYPSEPKFYKRLDDGTMLARGLVLFAILPKSDESFILVEVEKGRQEYTDFVPHNDCKSKYWLQRNGLRHTAFGLMASQYKFRWTELTEAEFMEERAKLLDAFTGLLKSRKDEANV